MESPPSQQSLLAALRSLPRPVWVLCLGTFLNKFGTFVMPFLTLYLTAEHFSNKQISIALGAFGAGHMLASILGGYMADAFGRRKTIVISMFSVGVSMLLLSWAHTFEALVFMTFVTGLTGELYRPAGNALLADLVPSNQRVTAYALYRLAFNAGWAFGPATAGFVATHSYKWLFIGDAVTSVLYGFVALIFLPKGVRHSKEQQSWGYALKTMRGDSAFLMLLLASLAAGMIFNQMGSTLGLHVISLGFSQGVYGLLLSLNGVLVVGFELLLTRFTQGYSATRVMAVGYTMLGVGFGINAIAGTLPILVASMTIFTIGEMVAIPISAAYVANLAPHDMRGRYMGVSGLTWAGAMVVGPGVGLMLYEIEPTLVWLCSLGFGLFAAAVILIPLRGRRVVPAPGVVPVK